MIQSLFDKLSQNLLGRLDKDRKGPKVVEPRSHRIKGLIKYYQLEAHRSKGSKRDWQLGRKGTSCKRDVKGQKGRLSTSPPPTSPSVSLKG